MKTIFVVDDNDLNLALVNKALHGLYRVFTMNSAFKMLELLKKIWPDLILLDIEMPEIDGLQALEVLKRQGATANIPVMFLTGRNDEELEIKGFKMGAVDFITKPFSSAVLVNRIKCHLAIDEIIHQRTRQLRRLQNGIVFVMADLVESRDKITGGHVERTTEYIRILAKALIEQDVYRAELQHWDFETLISSAKLHDVGKIHVSDLILNKPGKLTLQEFEIIKDHTVEGERIIDKMADHTGDEEFLRHARIFAGAHHERWDGSGYPRRLSGTDIPLQGRIMAFADVYDALISERPYKRAYSHEEAEQIISEDAGKSFDPHIASVFNRIQNQFERVGREK